MGQTNSRGDAAEFFQQHGQPPPGAAPGSSDTGMDATEPGERQPAQPVPTVLQWSLGGGSVYVTGSFNHWGERIPLRRSGADHVVCLNLLAGTYQYKFIVDNEWRYAADQPTVRDEMGNINNCLTVEDQTLYLHEDPCSGFFGNNPANFYTQALPDEITLAKEPPTVPAHLGVLSLNQSAMPEARIASWTLREPLSVTLTHICTQRNANSTTLSCTHRYRNKYITLIIYKPEHSAQLSSWQQQQQVAANEASATQQQQSQATPPAVPLEQQQEQHQAAAVAAAQQQAALHQQQELLYMQQLQQQQQQQAQQAGTMPPPPVPSATSLWGVPPPHEPGGAMPVPLAPPPLQQRVSWSDTVMHPATDAMMAPPQALAPSAGMAPPTAPMQGAAPPPLFKLTPTPGGLQAPPPMGDDLGGGMMLCAGGPGGGIMPPPPMISPSYCAAPATVGAGTAEGLGVGPQAMEMSSRHSSRHSSHATLMDTSGVAQASPLAGVPQWTAAAAAGGETRTDVVMR